MQERPIKFNAEMVRALLAGTKLETRRPHKYALRRNTRPIPAKCVGGWGLLHGTRATVNATATAPDCPFGNPRDRLWVQESWSQYGLHGRFDDVGGPWPDRKVLYGADGEHPASEAFWLSSELMPRWASRILLEVTQVRLERLQDIRYQGAVDEGVTVVGCAFPRGGHIAIDAFARLWDSIYLDKGHGWDANPWIWRVRFNVL